MSSNKNTIETLPKSSENKSKEVEDKTLTCMKLQADNALEEAKRMLDEAGKRNDASSLSKESVEKLMTIIKENESKLNISWGFEGVIGMTGCSGNTGTETPGEIEERDRVEEERIKKIRAEKEEKDSKGIPINTAIPHRIVLHLSVKPVKVEKREEAEAVCNLSIKICELVSEVLWYESGSKGHDVLVQTPKPERKEKIDILETLNLKIRDEFYDILLKLEAHDKAVRNENGREMDESDDEDEYEKVVPLKLSEKDEIALRQRLREVSDPPTMESKDAGIRIIPIPSVWYKEEWVWSGPSFRILMQHGQPLYDELLKSGLLQKNYPEWYKWGKY